MTPPLDTKAIRAVAITGTPGEWLVAAPSLLLTLCDELDEARATLANERGEGGRQGRGGGGTSTLGTGSVAASTSAGQTTTGRGGSTTPTSRTPPPAKRCARHDRRRQDPEPRMNTPVPLYTLSDQRKPAAYKCPVCTMIWSHNGDDYASTQAAKCCSTTCDVCGGPKPIRGYCQACQNRREAEHTAKLYADAEKITPAEWDGPVYNPFTDRYSASVGEALEAADEDDSPAPYLWPCDSDTAQIDPDRVVEEITEDMHEDYEVDDYAGLVAFCKEWNAKQTGATWSMNTVRVIVIEGDE